MKIKDIILVDKELDKPLPWYKSITAKLINFTTNHEFLIFKIAESDIVGSIDFYNDNRLVFRLGNNQTLV